MVSPSGLHRFSHTSLPVRRLKHVPPVYFSVTYCVCTMSLCLTARIYIGKSCWFYHQIRSYMPLRTSTLVQATIIAHLENCSRPCSWSLSSFPPKYFQHSNLTDPLETRARSHRFFAHAHQCLPIPLPGKKPKSFHVPARTWPHPRPTPWSPSASYSLGSRRTDLIFVNLPEHVPTLGC